LYSKSALQKSVQEMESWYRRWDPSWFLIARLALPEIDAAIREHRSETDGAAPLKIMGGLRDAHRASTDTNRSLLGFLPDNVAFYLQRQVDLSTASVCARSDSHTLAILDHVEYRPGTSEVDISNDVQNLARVMSNLDPVICNLLRCEGVKRNTDEAGRLRGFSLAFQMPPPRPSLSNEVVSSRNNNDRSTMVSGHSGGYMYLVVFADVCPDRNSLSAKLTTSPNACGVNQLSSCHRKKYGACCHIFTQRLFCSQEHPTRNTSYYRLRIVISRWLPKISLYCESYLHAR
jgi:hypothetical protein